MVVPSPPLPSSYYLRLAERRYRPTVRTEGAWQPGEQHMAPVSGVIVHAVERFLAARGADDLQICRMTFEILGMIRATDFDVEVEVVRPGRTIELLEATLTAGDRPTVRARIWRLVRADTSSVAGGQPAALEQPRTLEVWPAGTVWSGGYIASLEIRRLPGGVPGRTQAWLRTDVALVDGEPSSDLARFVGLVDTANGIAVREPPGRWLYPNVDLTIHLYRTPAGGWVGLDTEVVFGDGGLGLTSSTLHDVAGPVGRAEQMLTVRRIG